MFRILTCTLILVLAIQGCRQKDPAPQSGSGLPDFSCADTLNEGRFESWSGAEKQVFEQHVDPASGYPATELAGFADSLAINTRNYFFGSKQDLRLHCRLQANIACAYALFDVQHQQIVTGNFDNNRINAAGSAILPAPYALLRYPAGCGRLYYVCYNIDSRQVVTKGHFDIYLQ